MSSFGLPATDAGFDLTAMAGQAKIFSPGLFDLIDNVLWGLFWLFLIFRVVSGSWSHGLEYAGSEYKEDILRNRARAVDFRSRFKNRG